MSINLSNIAKKRGIKYFLISFVDLFGNLRSKLVPTRAIDGMQKDGAGFAGFAAWLDMTPAHPDMFAIPDPESFIQLPWKPEVGWLASDLWMDGKPVEASPRVALTRQLEQAEKLGFRMKTVITFTAFGRIKRDHMIANRQAGHAWANLDHHAGPLMAKDRRENPLGVIA